MDNALAQVIIELAARQEEAKKPSTIEYGEVISAEYAPLEIRVHDKLVLDEAFLELTNAVKDHWVDVEVYMETIDDNHLDREGYSHLHNIAGRKKIRVYNGLHTGEKVIMLRARGGQKYIVLDRLTDHIVGGEWRTEREAKTDDQNVKPFVPSGLPGWRKGAKSESKWPNAAKPDSFVPGADGPE